MRCHGSRSSFSTVVAFNFLAIFLTPTQILVSGEVFCAFLRRRSWARRGGAGRGRAGGWGRSPAARAVGKGRAGGGKTRAFARLVRIFGRRAGSHSKNGKREGPMGGRARVRECAGRQKRRRGRLGVASHWEGSGSALAYNQSKLGVVALLK